MEEKKKRNIFIRILKWLGIAVTSVLLLLIIIWLLLQTQWAQNILRQQAENYLNKKLKTTVRIGKIHINWFYNLQLDKVYIEDIKKQPLLYLGSLEASYKLLDLLNNQVSINKVHIDSLYVNIYNQPTDSTFNYDFIVKAFSDTTAQPVDTLSSGATLRWNLGKISLNKINAVYNDAYKGTRFDIGLKELSTQINQFNLDKLIFGANTLSLAQVRFAYKTPETSMEVQSEALTLNKPDFAAEPMSFGADKVAIANTSFRYDTNAVYRPVKYLDYNHLFLHDFSTHLSKIKYDGKNYYANIEHLVVKEQSGFEITALQSEAIYGEQQVTLKNTLLQTNRCIIHANADVRYLSLDELSRNPGHMSINAVFKNTTLQLQDLLYFQPSLAQNASMQPLLDKKIVLNTTVKGKVNNLQIDQLQLKEGPTTLDATATVTGLPDTDKMKIDLRLRTLSGTREGILSWLPKSTLPSSFNLPDRFALAGTYNGTLNDMNLNMNLNSSSGNLAVKGLLKNIADSKKAVYNVDVQTNNLQVNKILGDTGFGIASFKGHVEGHGYDLPTANIKFNANIAQFRAMGYTYTNIDANGTLVKNVASANITSKDSGVLGNIAVVYDMNAKQPSLQAHTNEMYVDLQRLGFSKDPLNIKLQLDADLPNANPDSLAGNVFISSMQIGYNSKIYTLDTIRVHAAQSDSGQVIALRSPIINAKMYGQYKLTTLGDGIQSILDHYLAKQENTKKITPAEVHIEGMISWPPVAKALVPDVKALSPMPFNAYLNTNNHQFSFNAATRRLHYADFNIDSLKIALQPVNDSLVYSVSINKMRHPSLPLHKTMVYGSIQKGLIGWNALLLDEKDKDRYRIAGSYEMEGKESIVRIASPLLLNKESWTVNADNKILLGEKGFAGANLILSNNQHSLAITSNNATSGFPADIVFTNFPLTTLTKLAVADTTLADGIINGNVKIMGTDPFGFTAGLTIDSLKAYNHPLGTLTIQADNKTKDAYTINAVLKNNQSTATVSGNYFATGNENLQLTVNLQSFAMATLEPFLKDVAENMKGNVEGQLSVTGSVDRPKVLGDLHLNRASLVYSAYNTYIYFPKETITFDDRGILFNQFIITDSLGDEAQLDGRILTNDYRNYAFDLRLNAKNFLAINKQLRPEQWVYGPANVDAKLTIKGDMDLPVIDGNVKLLDKSEVTVVIPSSDPSIEDRNGIIEFIDMDNPADSALLAKQGLDTSMQAKVSGISLNISAEVTPASSLTIVLDQDNGDYLKVKGTATLNASIDPSGQIGLTGKYTVSEGEYLLSLNQFIKRKFLIQKDGSITWSGDPYAAQLDLKAVYNVNTSAEELVANQVSSGNTGRLKQKLPFNVYLNLQGEMLKPNISFELDMPEKDRNAFDGMVYARIKQLNSDPSDLNKQVMGLLVLNHFISDNPFNSLNNDLASNAESMARSTAGKILSQQLNNLAGNLIKGIDLNFDLESKEDYSSGEKSNKTNLNVGVSKNLFNDRTIVTIGSSIPVEGGGQNAGSFAGNVTIEYKLSKDGRYRLKVYRITDNEATIEGQIIETGAGFTLVMDYDRFRELFERVKEKRIEKKRNKENE